MSAFDPLFSLDLVNGRFRETSRADLTALFNAMRADDARRSRLVVHFHGGLVTRESGAASAGVLMPAYHDLDKGAAYPVFFLWNTFGLDFVGGNFPDLLTAAAQQGLFDAALRKLLSFVAEKAGVPLDLGAARAIDGPEPLADLDIPWPEIDDPQVAEFTQAFATDPDVRLFAEQALAGAPTDLGGARALPQDALESPATLLDPRILAAVRADLDEEAGGAKALGVAEMIALARHAAKVLTRVIRRFREGRDHGVYHTVFEELMREFYLASIGEAVWGTMKKDAADAFGTDPACGGTAFLQELKAHLAQGFAPRITLVGHSAGAVYVAEFLKALDDQGFSPDVRCDVVLMAPAATFAKWHQTLADHAGRIRALRALSLSDAVEIADPCVPGVYKRSLLYLVSGAFEGPSGDEPILGMQRFHDPRFGPDVVAVLPSLSGNESFAPSAQTTAAHHGDFDDADATTRVTLAQIVRDGL